ncbi:MAG TPA: hypothetical protein VFP60_08715 [Pseudolabrys sp.]|nr:hypothetical protein [Pseudolabrys sp.]
MAETGLLNRLNPQRPRWAVAAAAVALIFGLVTIAVGGTTLFGPAERRAAAGNIVPFVLWFNFIAGFAYVAAGVGLFLWRRWAANLSAAIAITTVTVFAALAAHILLGGLFELRTIGAMTVRSLIWVVIAVLACRAMRCFEGMSRGSAA